ncbi:MAG: NAD(P)-dependent oxidoreductase [Thermoguttaceae bacterium]|jgi:nucleoside-diphosphate-sugar epimerase|nr:NAD(P)-dependent oxidoreductase [Thermoguttaceae bacterium]
MPDIKSVLVTGASGKLGAPLCEALVAEGYQVIAADLRLPVGVEGVEELQLNIADGPAVEAAVARSDAVIHLASCKEDRQAVIAVSAQGTFNLLDAAMQTKRPKRVILASGDAVNGIYFNRQPVPIREDMPMVAYPGYYPLSKVIEETMFQEYFWQAGVPTVCIRMSWIQSEDDILTHLTVAGESFGVPVWSELMNDQQRAEFAGGRDAVVALRHPDGTPMLRHIVAVEDCVQSYLLALKTEGIEGETFMIAMNDPFNYVEAAEYAAGKLGVETLELVDPVGQDFCIDTTKARYVLGYKPEYDIFSLIDKAVEFRRSGAKRRERSGAKG